MQGCVKINTNISAINIKFAGEYKYKIMNYYATKCNKYCYRYQNINTHLTKQKIL